MIMIINRVKMPKNRLKIVIFAVFLIVKKLKIAIKPRS